MFKQSRGHFRSPTRTGGLFCSFIFLSVPFVLSVSSPHALDLSYQHYLDGSILKEAIQVSLWDLESSERPEKLEVDITSTILGDESKLKTTIQALLPRETSENHDGAITRPPVGINLLARSNRITPKSLDDLFQLLVSNITSTNVIAKRQADEDEKNETQSESADTKNATSTIFLRPWKVDSLDLGWNEIHPSGPGWKSFLKSLQNLLQSREACPQTIRLDRCGLGPGICRSIGKGIMNRYACPYEERKSIKPLSLYFCGNPDLGDSGTAAIASAIRTVIKDSKPEEESCAILETLDLSSCEVGDEGAKALALALESRPGMCIRNLNLSNNKITDIGAEALAHALLSSGTDGSRTPALESLDLSGNKDIRDSSAIAIADAVGEGLILHIKLRSCHILADGAAAFGRALKSMAKRRTTPVSLQVDLSGNPLGVLRGKTDKGGKYSASAIKSKASATTAAYLKMVRKGIRSGLKEYGVDLPVGNSAESDDEEEARGGLGEEFVDGDLDPKKARCGIKAFANAILDDNGGKEPDEYVARPESFKYRLGLRRCFLDHGAADALAAVLVHSKDEMGIDLSLDVALNPVLEDEMTAALHGDDFSESYLREMSDRYLDALEALQASRERAAEAARAAAASIDAEAAYEAQWDAPTGYDDERWDDQEEEEEWDSDADYEKDDEDDYY